MERTMLLAFLVLVVFTLPASAVWPPAVRLTYGPNDNLHPDTWVPEQPLPGDTMVLVWQRSRPGGWDIYSRRNGNGLVWTASELVSSLPDSNLTPVIAAYNSHRYCAWVNCHSDSQNILCSRWANGSWGAPVDLTQDTFPNAGPTIWCAEYNDSVAVAWASLRNGHWNLYSRFYNGTSWSPVMPVIQDSADNRLPRLGRFEIWTTFRPMLYLAWQHEDAGVLNVWISRFVSGAWSAPQPISCGSQSDMQPATVKGYPVYKYDVSLVWASDTLGNFEIMGANPDTSVKERITNNDSSDTEPSALSHTFLAAPMALEHPVLTAWTSLRYGNPNIYAELHGVGQDCVDTNRADDRHPTVAAICAGLVHEWVIWESNRDGNWNLYGSHQDISDGGVASEGNVVDPLPERNQLRPAPFHPPGTLTLSLSGEEPQIDVILYDLQGRVLCKRSAQRRALGRYELVWDGRDALGRPLASGLYFLRAAGRRNLYRLVLLR